MSNSRLLGIIKFSVLSFIFIGLSALALIRFDVWGTYSSETKVYRSLLFRDICENSKFYGIDIGGGNVRLEIRRDDEGLTSFGEDSPYAEFCIGWYPMVFIANDFSKEVETLVKKIENDAFELRNLSAFSGRENPFKDICSSFSGKTISVKRARAVSKLGNFENLYQAKNGYSCMKESGYDDVSDALPSIEHNMTPNVEKALSLIEVTCYDDNECLNKEFEKVRMSGLAYVDEKFEKMSENETSEKDEELLKSDPFSQYCGNETVAGMNLYSDWRTSNRFIQAFNRQKNPIYEVKFYDYTLSPSYYDPYSKKLSTNLKVTGMSLNDEGCLIGFADKYGEDYEVEVVILVPKSKFEKFSSSENPIFQFGSDYAPLKKTHEEELAIDSVR